MKKNINRKKKGQSTLEYIILVTAVIVVMVLFLSPGGIFQQRVDQTYQTTMDVMVNMANKVRAANP